MSFSRRLFAAAELVVLATQRHRYMFRFVRRFPKAHIRGSNDDRGVLLSCTK